MAGSTSIFTPKTHHQLQLMQFSSFKTSLSKSVSFFTCPQHFPHIFPLPLIKWLRKSAQFCSTHTSPPRSTITHKPDKWKKQTNNIKTYCLLPSSEFVLFFPASTSTETSPHRRYSSDPPPRSCTSTQPLSTNTFINFPPLTPSST